MKKDYIKPAMQVVNLQHRNHILSGSNGAKGINRMSTNNEGITWKESGFTYEEDDM